MKPYKAHIAYLRVLELILNLPKRRPLRGKLNVCISSTLMLAALARR